MTIIGRIAVPAVLCGIGVLGVIADTWLVRAATRGHGVTSDPGYYERALAWDDQMEAKAAAARLGVSLSASLERAAEHAGRLCITLRDAKGTGLDAKDVIASASANLCPRIRVEPALERTGETYCGMVSEPCEGVWIIDVRAEVMGETIAASARAELGAAP